MAEESTELNRLIEEGLTLYGQGNLDGALLVWERVLTVDPDNAQANSYVDYVRQNYELLTSDLGDEDAGPFGIAADGEPEYQIEIVIPGEGQTTPFTQPMDPIDEGWSLNDDPGPQVRDTSPALSDNDNEMTLELEADEPPEPAGESFDDATREFEHARSRKPETPAVAEFGPEATPGFGTEQTGLRRRDLGFVKPTPSAPQPAVRSEVPELEIFVRTPQHGDDIDTTELRPPGSSEAETVFDRSYAEIEEELSFSPENPRALYITRDMPAELVPPHQRAALDAIELEEPDEPIEPPSGFPGVPTRELGVAYSVTETMDFVDKPTQQVDRPTFDANNSNSANNPMISAPTRELGLRTPGAIGESRTTTDDQPTLTTAKALLHSQIEQDDEGTRGDIVLPFDPIDARTAQILEEVDSTAPANESDEEKTRRRISTLIDQGQVWATAGELDKAVAAIDLALSEDPNSALAQKLIHRNRDTILGVFQSFLGNLDRQPSLARPLHELGSAPISPRAAFLLSRIDGSVTLDEILDISGMPRLEAYRYLCQLFLRGILR